MPCMVARRRSPRGAEYASPAGYSRGRASRTDKAVDPGTDCSWADREDGNHRDIPEAESLQVVVRRAVAPADFLDMTAVAAPGWLAVTVAALTAVARPWNQA